MKVLTLIYDEELESQVTPIFQKEMAVTRYSKIEGVLGARMDALAGSDYATARRNHLLLVITDDSTMERIVTDLRTLRERVGDGIRGVVTEAEVVI